MEEDKCDNCKFKDSSAWMPPCFGCGYGYNNFESADPSETMTEIMMNKVLSEYTDTAGIHHLIISLGDKTGDVVEYTSVKNCPSCGRKFTEDMICKCGINNANIRI